jgi:peptide/nickel transport system permease protein
MTVEAPTMTRPPHAASRRGELRTFWRRFRRNRGALIGLFVVLLVIASAFLAPLIAPENPSAQNLMRQNLSPSWEMPFGADQLGRDIFSRVLYGGQVALEVGLVAVGIGMVVGLLIGMVAGYFGRWVDETLMRVMDVLLAFPYLLLAIAIVAAIGPGLLNTMIAIAVWLIATYARLCRGVVLSIKEAYYVEAARAIGASAPAIMWRHLLPNCMTPILVQTTLDFARAILMEAGLSFLGYGVQPPAASWGSMIAEGRNELLIAPHIATIPGLAIVATVLSLNLVGDGLREALDPKAK